LDTMFINKSGLTLPITIGIKTKILNNEKNK
jgi:hypothetical protein